jgi:hypothetical protein
MFAATMGPPKHRRRPPYYYALNGTGRVAALPIADRIRATNHPATNVCPTIVRYRECCLTDVMTAEQFESHLTKYGASHVSLFVCVN